MKMYERGTILTKNTVVEKDHPRVVFRGKLDSLMAHILVLMSEFSTPEDVELYSKLNLIQINLSHIFESEVTGELFDKEFFFDCFGTYDEIREKSHAVGMLHVDGFIVDRRFVLLNRLRTHIREVEISAVRAICDDATIVPLNRLSSVVHIMMGEIMDEIILEDVDQVP